MQDVLGDTIRSAAASATAEGRRKIIHGLRDLADSLETPWEALQRILFSQTPLAMVRTCQEMKLFELLSKQEGPVSSGRLAAEAGANQRMTKRLLRYLQSVNIVKQLDEDSWAANETTRTLARPDYQHSIRWHADYIGACLRATPKWCVDNKFADVTSSKNCPFQTAYDTDEDVWVHNLKVPGFVDAGRGHMFAMRTGYPQWTDTYPIAATAKGWDPEKPLFVDVGGAVGQQTALLKERFPDLPGRVILQDQDYVLKGAPEVPGVEIMPHDFFTPQPVTGAKFYYLRNILHDWTDDKCVEILATLRPALGPDSLLVLDEIVLEEKNAPWEGQSLDIVLMVLLGARERTEMEWLAILDAAGYKLKAVHPYAPTFRDCAIVAVPK